MLRGQERSKDSIKQELEIPDEVAAIVEHQVSFFNNFTIDHILNHYEMGDSDMIVRFHKSELGILKGQEKFDQRKLIEIRCKVVASVLEELHNFYPSLINTLNLAVPFCFSDKPHKELKDIPSLSFSKTRYSNSILVPSINNLLGYQEFDFIDALDHPLLYKQDKMCVAASLTNIEWSGTGMENNQRLRIGEMAAKDPDSFFCKIMKPPKFDDAEWEGVCKKISLFFPHLYDSDCFTDLEERVNFEEQLKYKFQLCLDGHTCAWARLPWQMKSNSVTMRVRNQHHDFVEWFYYLLDPSKHYLEVEESRLMDAYKYLVNNPEHQLKICAAGSEFVDKYLHEDLSKRVFLYTLLLLNQKQVLQPER